MPRAIVVIDLRSYFFTWYLLYFKVLVVVGEGEEGRKRKETHITMNRTDSIVMSLSCLFSSVIIHIYIYIRSCFDFVFCFVFCCSCRA